MFFIMSRSVLASIYIMSKNAYVGVEFVDVVLSFC